MTKLQGFALARNLLLLRALIIAIFLCNNPALARMQKVDDKKITRSLLWLVNKMGSH